MIFAWKNAVKKGKQTSSDNRDLGFDAARRFETVFATNTRKERILWSDASFIVWVCLTCLYQRGTAMLLLEPAVVESKRSCACTHFVTCQLIFLWKVALADLK